MYQCLGAVLKAHNGWKVKGSKRTIRSLDGLTRLATPPKLQTESGMCRFDSQHRPSTEIILS